jgi:hypothetical protein
MTFASALHRFVKGSFGLIISFDVGSTMAFNATGSRATSSGIAAVFRSRSVTIYKVWIFNGLDL